jgi:hypothetical protein
MKRLYWLASTAAAGFIGWAHCHTDELPIVFGFVVITAALLGAFDAKRFLVNWAIIGAAIPADETLLHFGLIHAPYPPTSTGNLPIIALVSYLLALLGLAAGVGLRRLTGSAAIP